jgi:limonene-1,2-epoxide hydrolase
MSITRRELVAAGSLGALVTTLGAGPVSAAANPSRNQYEQAAIRLVTDFIATFPSRDVNQLAAFMSDDCEFQGAPSVTLWHGKAPFIKEMTGLVDPARGIIFAKKPNIIYAIGGEAGTGVLTERTDYVQSRRTELAAFFYVQNGKISAWHDLPLMPFRPQAGNSPAPGAR